MDRLEAWSRVIDRSVGRGSARLTSSEAHSRVSLIPNAIIMFQ